MEQPELLPHLFRSEFSKITAVLCKYFGIAHIEIAEDIAGDTFLSAAETWSYKGLPANPVAWLYTVAKNKARNYIQHQTVFTQKITPQVKYISPAIDEPDIDLSDRNITDSQLQMLFVICHPCISAPAQIGLALRILCGFGIEEIAHAFLTNKETISKRLTRAREKLRTEQIRIELPDATEIGRRLENVATTLYLLFSEGYYSESNDTIVRKDLCLEAIRLTYLLTQQEQTNLPFIRALLSLMCFQASRFDARKDEHGMMILYHDQDETLWDRELIAKGVYFLHEASGGNSISKYHAEAAIAYWHTIKTDTIEKWEHILHLYDTLLQIEYTPVAALNRIYALARVKGNEIAIREAERLELTANHYYFALLGALYKSTDSQKAKYFFEKAYSLAATKPDRQALQRQIDLL